jgi:ankyrin repeat protein
MKKSITVLHLFGIKDIDEYDAVLKRLNEGFDINTFDSGGRTLLMEAVIRKNQKLAELLIERGADVNRRDERNWTALHFAAQEYDPISTRLLLQSEADVNAQNDFGNSVISTAVFNCDGTDVVIRLLINYGADINIKNNSGISALDLAKSITNYNITPFLSDALFLN